MNPRRTKPRRWVFNHSIDQIIRGIYQERADKRHHPLPSLKTFADQIQWPYWAAKRRGVELGLARARDHAWSEKELLLLNKYAWMSLEVIRLKQNRKGFSRTITAIQGKLHRMGYKYTGDHYSAQSLAQCFGVDVHCVIRWIRRGHLRAKRRGTLWRRPQQGDFWLIHEKDVFRFIVGNPHKYSLRKVDQAWFLYVITRGMIAA